jgi:hypothetical protein
MPKGIGKGESTPGGGARQPDLFAGLPEKPIWGSVGTKSAKSQRISLNHSLRGGTKSSWTLEKANLLQEEEQDNQSRITGGHASMDVEVVEKTTKSGGFWYFFWDRPVRTKGAIPLAKQSPACFFDAPYQSCKFGGL